ncbi:MAG: hypothetical protein K2X55_18710 [Burkholderiaceae bacterium]|nr:hypothetical protein [Burkholderiaceae bacterium]
MTSAYHNIGRGLLPMATALVVALPAAATINQSDGFPAASHDKLQQYTAPIETTPPLNWLEQPMQSMTTADTGLAIGMITPATLLVGHTTHIGRQREDLDLSANDSAARRYNLVDEEPLVSEQWWQALPGIVVALFLGLALYMRHPIQRKRKYRSTPHEPTGPYKRKDRR